MGLKHFFDWEGFTFVGKILAASIIVGLATHFGPLYFKTLHPAPALAPVVAQETMPTPILPVATSTQSYSTTTPERVINSLTITDAVPQTGKFIVADLATMKLTLYQDGVATSGYPILTKGKTGSPYETPSGFYRVLTKETDHLNSREGVYMPYSMQFYGNYFIHGWPYYADGTPVESSYSGGCIRLSTVDAGKVYAFAEKGTGIFVYDPVDTASMPTLVLSTMPAPPVSAASYLVADIDTGDVYLEQNAEEPRPIASLTKLMTALVANETIMFDDKITITRGELLYPGSATSTQKETFAVNDLFYPLLMESNNAVADRLARYYGTKGFVDWMNTTANALDMQSTHYKDASGVSASNVSTPDDLYRLAAYLADKKSFIWDITRTPTKEVISDSGDVYYFSNFNIFSGSPDFLGGKVGQTAAAQDTMASIFSVSVNGISRRAAIIVLKSDNFATDTEKLADWFIQSAEQGAVMAGTACASCIAPPQYRKIQK